MVVRRPEALAVLEEFMRTEMAIGCRLLSPFEARRRCPQLTSPALQGVLESSVELRVESRIAIPLLASWLTAAHGVLFLRETAVLRIELPAVHTSRGVVRAQRVIACPGDDFNTLFAQRIATFGLTRCKLQMLRLADPGFRLPGVFMSDLGLGRYHGYADLDCAGTLRSRLALEQPEHLRHGIHLIVAQSSDGSLIVGDSHHYAPTPDPFRYETVDELILEEFKAALGFEPPPVRERWIGTYASCADRPVVIDAPEAGVRLAIVTCGAGASIGFALGEELVSSLLEVGVSA